ncbi:MAG: DUF4232 domain-containing protein, partial [Candidatus Limnocylindrales bacterium]
VGVTASGVATVAQENTSGLLTFPAITGVPTVTLGPGDAAFAAFAGSDNPGTVTATCPPPYQSLRVAPPGSTASVSMSAWNTWLGAYAPACAGLAVTFIVPSSSVPELEPLRP